MTKNKQKKLEKATQNIFGSKDKKVKKKKQEGISLSTKIAAGFFLILMISGVVGFALSQSPQAMSQIGQGGDQMQQNIPVQRFEQQGQVFWAAMKNGVVFEFENPEIYQEQTDLQAVADQLKTQQQVEIYNDGFDSTSLFLIEEYLYAAEIENTRISNSQCNQNTLYLTTSEEIPEGECMVIQAEEGEQRFRTDALLYFLLENI